MLSVTLRVARDEHVYALRVCQRYAIIDSLILIIRARDVLLPLTRYVTHTMISWLRLACRRCC